MLVSTRGRYALLVLIDLARRQAAGNVPLREIAAREGISEKYLEGILSALVQHGLLLGTRGRGGGYRLAWPPERYTLRRILELTEGSLAPVACLDGARPGCGRAASCPALPVWRELDGIVTRYLEGVTLADLLRSSPGPDYVI